MGRSEPRQSVVGRWYENPDTLHKCEYPLYEYRTTTLDELWRDVIWACLTVRF